MSFRFASSKLCLTYSNVNQQQRNIFERTIGCYLSGNPNELSATHSGREPILDNAMETTNSSVNSNTILTELTRILGGYGIRYIIIAREHHKSTGIHFHVGISLDREYRSRDPRSLDCFGLHPNIQSARSFRKWVAYLKKEGDYIEQGKLELNKPGPKEIIEMAKDMDKLEFLATMSTMKLQYGPTIWEMAHPDLNSTITEDDCLDTAKYVDASILNYFLTTVWEPSKVLVLHGDTGLGKTSMAKILISKPALMVSHLDDLKRFRPGYHKGILFDDVSVKHIPETGQIHLVDWYEPRSIHVRYGTVFIPKNTPKIFTCNQYPLSPNPAIDRRVQAVKCTKPFK